MDKKKRKRRRRSSLSYIVTLILVIAVYIAASYVEYNEIDIGFEINLKEANFFEILDSIKSELNGSDRDKNPSLTDGEEIRFYILDIGQGDAILVTSPDGNMLIDTSISSQRDELVGYLEEFDVTVIDYLVLTHTDADHIGNADYIINNYEVSNILLPDYETDTKTYLRMIEAIENSDANVIEFEIGYTFYIGELVNTVLAPVDEYDDANEMSIVIKSVYGETSVMLTGDAEHKSEEDVVDYWDEDILDCDILKVGHHGSRTSSTDEFLEAVTPEIAIISCGIDNIYGHPHTETIQKLEEADIRTYVTYEDGTVVIVTDGILYEINTIPSD